MAVIPLFRLAIFVCLVPFSASAQDQGGAVVISQLYGAGGNSGAVFRQDFIELFNRGTRAAVIDGWSVQYSSATGTTWQKVDLAGRIGPGERFLIQLAGGANGAELPKPDALGTINMSASSGKVALIADGVLLGAGCPDRNRVIDLVGYGSTAACFEGSAPAPAPSSSRAIIRAADGCADSNDNAADFATGTPAPRNSASPAAGCQGDPEPGDDGLPFPATSEPGGPKTGSILIFPIYSSDPLSNVSRNTRISLTNTDPEMPVTVRLVLVDGDAAGAVDGLLCLGPGRTASFLASDLDPGVTGYLIAVAVDPVSGCPAPANRLIGDAFVKLDMLRAASLPAFAVAAIADPPAACAAQAVEIAFDGISYGRLPGEVAFVVSDSAESGVEPVLVLLRPESVIEGVSGLVFDGAGISRDFSWKVGRSHLVSPVSGMVRPGDGRGWARLRCHDGGAILGALIGAAEGRNLHVLGPAQDARWFMPVIQGGC